MSRPAARPDGARVRVLEAAERLLRNGAPDFSMRDLAAEAGVSFATPFNQFGSKAALMQSLSAQRIGAMAERFDSMAPLATAVARVFAAVDIAAAVMLAEPAVNRAVMASIGASTLRPGSAYRESRALWLRAIGDGEGFDPDQAALARTVLPDHLAMAFRGVLSFWTAGEVTDDELAARARAAAATLLLGFAGVTCRATVLSVVRATPP